MKKKMMMIMMRFVLCIMIEPILILLNLTIHLVSGFYFLFLLFVFVSNRQVVVGIDFDSHLERGIKCSKLKSTLSFLYSNLFPHILNNNNNNFNQSSSSNNNNQFKQISNQFQSAIQVLQLK